MPVFSRLELENFKSYRSHTIIEWKQVSSILGQNGTGKSTVIDAIEYVFYFPRYAKRSTKTLKQSLYYNKSKKDDNSSTWVKAIVNINNEEREFKRATDYKGSVHKFWVDNKVVTLQEYINSLLQVNVNPDANNFLVQQNTIELLGLKNAKERGEFFEMLSGSIFYKAEYERLVKVIKNIQSEMTSFKSILDLHKTEKENLIKRSEQIKLYDDLLQQLKQAEFDYYYIKLYEIQTRVDRLLQQKQKKQLFLNKMAKLLKEFNEKVQKYKSDIEEKEQKIRDIETHLEKYEPEILDYNRKGAELTEKIELCRNEIEKVEKNLNKAKSMHSAHEQNLKKLRKEANDVEKLRNEFDKSVSQSCSVELDDEQYDLYLWLKAEVQKQLVKESQHILTLERKRNNIKDKIEWYEMKEKEISGQIENEQLLLNKFHAQKDYVEKKIDETKSEIQIAETRSTELDLEIKNLYEEVESTIKKIQEYNGQLSDFDVGKEERSHQHRTEEIAETLKELFPYRVLGPVSHLCEITNLEKYGIAVTQILNKKMDGIVVDTANTAAKCIQFLKEHYKDHMYSAVGTFYPLDDCRTTTLPKHTLEIIESKPFAKLAVNVMQTTSIKNLLQKFLGHIVICETEDQAMELSKSLRLNCVSLSGSYFKNDGIISGGRSDIKNKAKKWKENEYMNMERNKEKETQYLRSKQEDIRKKQSSKTKEQEKRSSLRRRLDEYLKPQLKELNERINTKQNDLEKLKNNLDSLIQKSKIDEWRESLSGLDKQLNNYKQREHEIEDEVFSKFCEKFQLENIRKYEEDDVKKLEERRKRRLELEDQLSKINNQIEAEESRDTEAPISKLNKKIEKLKKEEKVFLKERENWKKLENKYNKRTASEHEIRSIKREIDKIEKELAFEKRKLKAATVDFKDNEKNIATLDLMIQKLQRVEIHKILLKCKVKGFDIPLEQGTIDKIFVHPRMLGTESESNGQQTDSDSMIHEKNVKIDFSGLDESIQNLEESDLTIRLNALAAQRKELKEKLESCIPTNRDLKRELDSIDAKIKKAKKDIKTKQSECKTARDELEEVKKTRKDVFEKFLEPVEKKIDGTFKSLYNNAAAQACINAINAEEPYLDGIDVGFVIPGKKFTKIEHLSGGEKSMCAMALFLTVYSAKPAPCIIFDEIDAALDNANLQNIVQLYLKWKQTTQIISISHHECLFRCSDAAIGINFSDRRNSSYAIHVDLSPYLRHFDIDRTLAIQGTPSRSAREVTPTTPEDNTASVALPSLTSSSRRTTYGEPQHASTPKRSIGEESERAVTPKSERSSIGEPKHASTPSSSPKSKIGDAQQTSRGTGKIIIKSVEIIHKAKDEKKSKSDSSEGKDTQLSASMGRLK